MPFVKREEVELPARHEAAHAAAAHILGWYVDRVVVRRDGSGLTVYYREADLAPDREAAEQAVIAASAEAYVGWRSGRDYESDRRTVLKALDFCPDLRSQQLYHAELKRHVEEFVAGHRFRALARRVTDALIDAGGVLEGEPLSVALRRL